MGQTQLWRQQAAKSLAVLIPKIQGGVGAQDGLVDDLMRSLNNLPGRPADRQAYAGLFPAADADTWRKQAATALQGLIQKIEDISGSAIDGQVDDLLRALNNLPARPAGRPAYSGLFAPADLPTWRKQAAQSLGNISPKMDPSQLLPVDGKIDDLLRALNKLPGRPAGRNPYEGLFGTGSPADYRRQANQVLQKLVANLQDDINPKDAQVDALIRTLNNLPPRPAAQEPYSGLFPKASTGFITAEQLKQICPYADSGRLAKLAPALNATMERYAINTPLRIAHFIAQTAHESDNYNTNEEYASGEDYEGRGEGDLGNIYPGDGPRFKGRGLIQVTGRTNYEECGKALGVDLINNPERLGDFDLACMSAGWFWDKMELNGDADKDDVKTITRLINGGYNGLDHRMESLENAKRVLGIPH